MTVLEVRVEESFKRIDKIIELAIERLEDLQKTYRPVNINANRKAKNEN